MTCRVLLDGRTTPWSPLRMNSTCESSFEGGSHSWLIKPRFGGTNGVQCFNDCWKYNPRTKLWLYMHCIGPIPVSRESHSAVVVGVFMYVFGGRTQEGRDLGDLAALQLDTFRWFTFQNMGPSPSPRSGHSMCVYGSKIHVFGGEPTVKSSNDDELSLVYVLDTSMIRYPLGD